MGIILTTLIIQPLASNVSGDGKIQFKILTQQKKNLNLKIKCMRLAGDICI